MATRKAALDTVRVAFGSDGFATLTMTRPKVHNALSDGMIAAMRERLAEVRKEAPRGLFIRAEGKSFSAGADLDWMKRAATYSKEENVADAMELSGMLHDLATLPLPTVALVQGAAIGGGVGIVSACDLAVGVSSAKFMLSEVKLGLIPATISPYVVQRIGAQQSRRFFLTAERIDALEARRIGLLHEVVEDSNALDTFEKWAKDHFSVNAPQAMATSKALIDVVAHKDITPELRLETAKMLADQRDSDECREGIAAFFEKRDGPFVLPESK
ncbi:Methylglutaconyl-CoA hydratase, mitochondrial [Hondaea fermentalgiana]|uniref:Methylglutaconyl-CoA hydratase, mitochondrial n=1 Tax=Hondaea fermentalgiana TaxID=2315210 RepID=A0A2R5GDG7_9STRA|nr:Methylglutaconyl-CoA hydratase, mitochondrial [Hondaea fermentalgiana]|eukprot:GBG28996.1 Methylglutaconyl-CoA hydratase, mitochondrial [Hondaea fermentalgiana]